MKKIIYFLLMSMIIHSSLIAQPNSDRRQGPPPPPPGAYQRGDDQRRDDRGPGPRRGERMRPEQREKIEMFKIQFITKNFMKHIKKKCKKS